MTTETALVVGGATGIGAEAVRQMASSGRRVVIVDINERDGRQLADEVGGAFYHGDVTDDASLASAIEQCVNEVGVPDYALLNSGVMTAPGDAPFLAVHEAPLEAYRRVMSVNVDGVFHGLRHLIPLMLDRGGAITVTASRAGLVPTAPDAIYAASKAAAIHLVRSAAQGIRGQKLRINALCPATVDTTLIADVVRQAGIPLITAADMAGEAVDLMLTGDNGEVRVKLHDKPAFTIGVFDANVEYQAPDEGQ
ncbi:SDR family NAD(P)-dependent oxidoreductase [Ilumatobacter nonamiensis]|uniref:SDR family NAD(P)-dependent oxidoreductase n=1 Tax=Ilumatobacter nonamiensis TaxID=467093 RepID=UPI00034D2A1B|nr:SDR family NAD(P)-dependent oxidoreductase [Ilumatobacter nonamiensis]